MIDAHMLRLATCLTLSLLDHLVHELHLVLRVVIARRHHRCCTSCPAKTWHVTAKFTESLMELAAYRAATVRERHGGRVPVVVWKITQERVLLPRRWNCKVFHRLHVVTHRHEILGRNASLLDHIWSYILFICEGLAHA